jgi:hypothetical protein
MREGEVQSALLEIRTPTDNIFTVSAPKFTTIAVNFFSKNLSSAGEKLAIFDIRVLANLSPGNYSIPLEINTTNPQGSEGFSEIHYLKLMVISPPPPFTLPSIPVEYLIGLYTLAASIFTTWAVPNGVKFVNERKQRKRVPGYKTSLAVSWISSKYERL